MAVRRPLAARSALALALALVLVLAACERPGEPARPGTASSGQHDDDAVAASDLFISEYVEGGSLDKAIEIYNGTDATVDLAAGSYVVQVFSNGAATPSRTVVLAGTVVAGDVFVVANPRAGGTIAFDTDITDSGVSWNGNDAVALVKDGAFLDVIGQIGVDPGSEWGSG
ncbi:MAG: lamin tail domain-containing protein, partial [Trueperaceae bacterium]